VANQQLISNTYYYSYIITKLKIPANKALV